MRNIGSSFTLYAVMVPEEIDVIREVSGDPACTNREIAGIKMIGG